METPQSQNKKSTMTISSASNLGNQELSQMPDSMTRSKKTPTKSLPTTSRALLMLSPESSNSLLKTPKKTPIKSLLDHMSQSSIDQALSPMQEKAEEAAQNFQKFLTMSDSESLSSITFKTPVKENISGANRLRSSSKKTPLSKKTSSSSSSSQMVPNSPTAKTIEEALCTLLKTPVKEQQQSTASNNSRIPSDSSLKKTPLSKLSKKSPMPSPFLGSPILGGTPSKDISLASISFNQNEIHVTPSLGNYDDDHQKSLTLEISPESGGLHTPSPTQGDGPLITPPLGEQHHGGNPNDQNSLTTSMITPRTPRGVGISNEIIMNTPLKALSDAAKRLFTNEVN